jgi:glycosyltransferase involved in cell wall biosynthesis
LRIAFLTHEPFYPPSGGGSAEAVYLVKEMTRRGHRVQVFGPEIPDAAAVEGRFGVKLVPFTKWKMGRYARLRNLKYVVYPFFLERMVAAAGKGTFDLIFSQHAISAVAAGKLKSRLGVPVLMNFPDLLTGFMETWPAYVAPQPLVQALMRYEISLPVRYHVDGVCTISGEFADRLAARGFPQDRICPIYYGYDAQAFPLRARPPAAGQPPVVVMHGSFDAHHLGAIALEAARVVVAKRPETVFRFVGRRTSGLEKFLNRAQAIPNFKFEAAGFTPYAEVSGQLAGASVGIVPYEESAGTHCAFVAKIVEYVATGLPTVCTPLKSVRSYFKSDPLVKFSSFDGVDFGGRILEWLDAPVSSWLPHAEASSARVRADLDWRPLCRKAVDFAERVAGNNVPNSAGAAASSAPASSAS